MAILRARMSELLAPAMRAAPDRAFTAGLFSLLDALTGRQMDELVSELSFDDRLATRSSSREGPEGARARRHARLRARGVRRRCRACVDAEVLADAYTQALRWGDELAPAAA